LYLHGFFALGVAVFILLVVRDTPQSQGLPAIELHRNDYPKAFDYDPEHEKEFSTKQIFVDYVLRNKLLWFIAVANAFVYFVRRPISARSNAFRLRMQVGPTPSMNSRVSPGRFSPGGCRTRCLTDVAPRLQSCSCWRLWFASSSIG
jgi:hypothetical protein